MKTRSVLVWFPGNPFDPTMLLPKCRLATVTACLLEGGHETLALDYGNVHLIDRLFRDGALEPVRLKAASSNLSQNEGFALPLCRVLETHSLQRRFWEQVDAVCRETARQQGFSGLDFVAFQIDAPSDWRPATVIAETLKAQYPDIKTIVFGKEVESLWAAPTGAQRRFDALCVGDPETTIARWAEHLARPATWETLPNLIAANRHGRKPLRRRATTDLGLLPLPAYHLETYPALADGQKALLFELEESRGCSQRCHGCHEAAPDRPLRLKPAPRIRDEMAALAEQFGAQAFRINGSHSTWEQVCGTAQAILGSGLQVVYSRKGPIQWAKEKTFPFLHASGCTAMGFRVESGSQRLLDLHYGRNLGISHVEQGFRACKASGILLGVEMCYPCPEDDHHTFAETLRFLWRTKPDSVRVELPEVPVRTAWHSRSQEFGYHGKQRNGSWRRLESGGQPHPELGGWRTPSVGIAGLSPAQVTQAHEDLLLAIHEDLGLRSFPEELAVLARFTGFGGREAELADLMRQQLLSGDSPALADLVAAFNKEACTPARVEAFVPFTPVPMAVGN